MNIVYKKLEDLKVYENNAKIHTDEQIAQIAESITKVGFLDPIGVDENNMIIEGHGRYYAAQKLDMKEVPCIELVGLTEVQKKSYIIAHNKLTMNTGNDFDKLSKELKALKELEFKDFSSIGFSLEEVETYIDEIEYDNILLDEFKNKSPKKKKKYTCPECGHEWED